MVTPGDATKLEVQVAARKSQRDPLRLVIPPALAEMLERTHMTLVSQGYLGSLSDLAREILARDLTGRHPLEEVFAVARVAGSNRAYSLTVAALRRFTMALHHYFELGERAHGLQHCESCGGPILPEAEKVLSELQEPLAMERMEKLRGSGQHS